jgi:hypothetical protein
MLRERKNLLKKVQEANEKIKQAIIRKKYSSKIVEADK